MGKVNKSKRGRKVGNKKKKPAQMRYVREDHLGRNRRRRVARFQRMVAASERRRAAQAAREAHGHQG